MSTTQETLVKNGIKIVQISASYERKISDGQYGSMGGFFSMTADVEPIAAIEDQINLLFAFVRETAAKQLKPEFTKTKDAIAKATDRAVNVEAPHTTTTTPAPVAPQSPAAPSSASGGMLTIRAVKMTVTPRTDGKADVKFFEQGHQYPDIYATKTPAELVTMLKTTGAWTPQHFAAAGEYQVNFVIDYKLSEKLNTKGNPYKDIVTISAA